MHLTSSTVSRVNGLKLSKKTILPSVVLKAKTKKMTCVP